MVTAQNDLNALRKDFINKYVFYNNATVVAPVVVKYYNIQAIIKDYYAQKIQYDVQQRKKI